jgi:beta-glucanase (GH16 family)
MRLDNTLRLSARWIALIGMIHMTPVDAHLGETTSRGADSKGEVSSMDGTPSMLPALPKGKKWNLIFKDEFSGSSLDSTKWTRKIQWRQPIDPDYRILWSPKACEVSNGHLSMSITHQGKDPDTGKETFYSGGLRSIGKFESGFGYYEARVRILGGSPGVNAAFWLMSPDVEKADDSGRDGTEIDIIEMPWHDGRIQHALHWDGYGEHHRHTNEVLSASEELQPGEWVTVGCWWTPEEYRFYVNGELSWRSTDGGVSQAKDAHLLLSSTVSAPWGVKSGASFQSESLPAIFMVDHVRVYSLSTKDIFESSLVVDGSFERELWKLSPKGAEHVEFSYSSERGERVEGEKALKVSIDDSKRKHWVTAKAFLNLKSHTKYQLSFLGKTDEKESRISLFLTTEGQVLERSFDLKSAKQIHSLGQNWASYKTSFSTGDLNEVVDQCTLMFRFRDFGTCYLDDVSVIEISSL